MGQIDRHSGAPFADGETLAGADLEGDFNTIYTEFNGNIEDTNIKALANIAGSKLADGGISTAKLADDGVTLGKMAAAAVAKVGFEVATGTATATVNTTTAQLVPGISGVTITPGSTDDILLLDFNAVLTASDYSSYGFRFEIDGTNEAFSGWWAQSSDADVGRYGTGLSMHSAVQATSTSAVTVKVRHIYSGLNAQATFQHPNDTTNGISRQLRVICVPIKV